MEFTLIFTKRERYCKAVNAIWRNPKFRMDCRGKFLEGGKWYVTFESVRW